MLDHLTVLVVEQEFLIALDIQRMLEVMGSVQPIFARSPDEAIAQEHVWQRLSLAVIELSPGEPTGLDLAKRLSAAGIALVICTTDSNLRHGLPELPSAPVVLKPILESDMANAVSRALATNRSTP